MANKTIPQLPLQTGITDNDLLAIVDSGETTTSRITVSTLLSGVAAGVYEAGSGTDSIQPVANGVASGTNSVVLNANANNSATNNNAIAGGNNADATGAGSVALGNRNNATGTYSAAVGGDNNSASSNGTFIGGGYNQSSGAYSGIIAGYGNTNLTYHFIAGSGFSNITGEGGVIIGGNGTNMRSSTASNPSTGNIMIFAPSQHIRRDNGTGTSSILGELNGLICTNGSEINGQSGNEAVRSLIIGGLDTDLTGGTTNTIALGTSGRTCTESYAVYGEDFRAFQHFIMEDYSNLNFASDSAAATGGVPLGGLYHNSGDVKVRIT